MNEITYIDQFDKVVRLNWYEARRGLNRTIVDESFPIRLEARRGWDRRDIGHFANEHLAEEVAMHFQSVGYNFGFPKYGDSSATTSGGEG